MIRVYVDAVADLFHVGHLTFFRRARALLCDSDDVVLVVGIHSDQTTEAYKRRPVIAQAQRYEMVRACRYVDEVIEDAPLILTPAYLREHRIDAVVRANDIQPDDPQIAQISDKLHWVPYASGVNTTSIVERIRVLSDHSRSPEK
jgi:cytidyltransferase-like protein